MLDGEVKVGVQGAGDVYLGTVGGLGRCVDEGRELTSIRTRRK